MPPGSFDPPPKVDSAVVRMIPLATPPEVDLPEFAKMVAVAFSQRRKILRHTLGAWMAEHGPITRTLRKLTRAITPKSPAAQPAE